MVVLTVATRLGKENALFKYSLMKDSYNNIALNVIIIFSGGKAAGKLISWKVSWKVSLGEGYCDFG